MCGEYLVKFFGFDVCVKRIYVKGPGLYCTQTLEITLKRVAVLIVYAEKVKSGA